MTEKVLKVPENSQWTEEQWQAIVESGKDILVAAAAGSGKTAVLVERIIHKVTNPETAVDVDRLLVVTFTNAAAAEMRARIGQALDQALVANPDSEFLRKQMLLLNRAQIMTFHAFCMSVIKRYYYLLDLDPGFRTAEQTEAELLREEVLNELLEEYYGQDNSAFYQLVDAYTNDRSDNYLQSLILKLYDFSRSHPSPNLWLDEMKQAYDLNPDIEVDDLPWTKDLKSHVRLQLMGLLPILDQANELCEAPGGPIPYLENLREDRSLVMNLLETTHGPWVSLYLAFNEVTFSNLKRVSKKETDALLQDQVKKLRDTVKKRVNNLKSELFLRRPEDQVVEIKQMAPHVSLLVELVKEFSVRYQLIKQEKALVDFSDLEHYCLQILSEEDLDGNHHPTTVALKYRENFAELLVDEYQDTNFVQETILQLISEDQSTSSGNLFMVGDVKQSIYRFRLAEPSLFLDKYKRFATFNNLGMKIDLANNFRSRQEIIDGTNFIFKQIMDENVGEIDYDEAAELKFGARYYPDQESNNEWMIIDRKDGGEGEEQDGNDSDPAFEENVDQVLQTAELEAIQMAKRIKQLLGEDEKRRFQVYDKQLKRNRPIQFRDIVILLRSVQNTAPLIMDVLKAYGIPVHAELSSGYFEATEVSVMMALLNVIDNPHQDIPIASVLRSPIIGLTGEELAQIRLAEPKEDYYTAIQEYRKQNADELKIKLDLFINNVNEWRNRARIGSLADLIWQIYRDTGYYDYVAGTAGGSQRQANLKALYDRARQYESTSFRGLFRFLRFIERIQDRGDDLGEARAVGEQEDVVRIMTIHKSKGLEYPVVFVGGLNRNFNRKDIYQNTLFHKSLGFATKYIDSIKRITYPTLAYSATKYKLEMELLAEEMRVLYVALTRAQEKLILVSTTKDLEKDCKKWHSAAESRRWLIQDDARYQAKTYFDWIGPALFRHSDASILHTLVAQEKSTEKLLEHPSRWSISTVQAKELQRDSLTLVSDQAEIISKVKNLEPVPFESPHVEQVKHQLEWRYAYDKATNAMAKQTVTEIKRQQEHLNDGYDTMYLKEFRFPIGDRPKFLQDKSLTANERGTAMHLLMQHIDLSQWMTNATIQDTVDRMLVHEIFTQKQVEAIDVPLVREFFESPLGKRMLNAKRVTRELPFSLMVNASEAYGHWQGHNDEKVLVQGVIDSIIEDEEGITLLDYKTDSVTLKFESLDEAKRKLTAKYQVQLALYRKAIETIWKKRVKDCYLYFFDGSFFIKV